MEIAVIGVNHENAPIKIREKFSLTHTQQIEMLGQLVNFDISEAVILSTCNRSETYISSMNLEKSIAVVKEIVGDATKLEDVSPYLFVKKGLDALKHLYQVTAGFKSIVIGEDQILGQVKEAHELAMTVGASGKILNKCFREAITTAKRIKAETNISHYPLSISSIGIKFMKEQMGTLENKNVLLIGAGKMNQLALNHLGEEAVGNIYMANRTRCKVRGLKQDYPGIIDIPYEERYTLLEQVDFVITCTASPHVILKREYMPKLKKPLFILDMALPRDVEEEVGLVDHIELYNIDALEEIAYQNSIKRDTLAKEGQGFIEDSIETLYSWALSTKVDPTIRSLQERCEEIQEDTMSYLRRKIDFSCREEKLVEKMLMSSLNRLMREPIAKLKEIQVSEKQIEYIKVLEDLFNL